MAGLFDDLIPGAKSAANYGPFADLVPKDTGDLGRGLIESFQQLPQLGYGLMAGAGAAAESAFGEGGIATGIKKSGVKGYNEWGDKIASQAKESDSWSYSYDQAKEGNFGALVDWLQHGIGYVGGQGIQALATAGLGAAVGKMTAQGIANNIAAGMVAKEAAALTAANAGALTAEQIAAQATANVAAKFGQIAALGGMATGQEGGEIFGDLSKQSVDENRPLTGAEIGKAFGATLAAGGLEFVGDKLGLDIITGKSRIGKSLMGAAGEATGIGGKLARGGLAGLAAVPAEAGTEYFQTGIEEFGKGKEASPLPWQQSPERAQGAIDAAALGALGGGAIGLGGGLMSRARRADDAAGRLPTASTADEAINLALTATDVPLTVPPNFNADAAMGNLEAQRQKDEAGLRDFSGRSVVPGLASPVTQTLPLDKAAEPAAETIDSPFGDRLLTLREQLGDKRVRAAIRQNLGVDALGDALYYATQADKPNAALEAPIPDVTRDRLLGMAEAIVSRSTLRPVNRPGVAGQQAPIGLPAPAGQARIGLDTAPTGAIRVDAQGNAAPETRADVIAGQRQRPDGMTQQVEPSPLPRDGVMVGDGVLNTPASLRDRAQAMRRLGVPNEPVPDVAGIAPIPTGPADGGGDQFGGGGGVVRPEPGNGRRDDRSSAAPELGSRAAGAVSPANGAAAALSAELAPAAPSESKSASTSTPPLAVWNGVGGNGISNAVGARQQIPNANQKHPGLQWTAVPAPEFGDGKFKLEGRSPAAVSLPADRTNTPEVIELRQRLSVLRALKECLA